MFLPPTIPADKAQHFFYGAMAGLAGACTAAVAHAAWRWPIIMVPLMALLFAAVAGWLKEWMDARANRAAAAAGEAAPHEVSTADILWTAAGGAPAAIAALGVVVVRHA